MPHQILSPGLTIHFLDPNPRGNPPVLLLHGLGATGEAWNLQIPVLIDKGFRVLVPDCRGFGKSTYPGGDHTIADLASDLVKLLDALHITTAHVVGISMGGAIALQLASEHGARVHKLVLVNTFANFRPGSIKTWLYFATRFIMVHTLGLPAQARLVTKHIFPKPHQEYLRQILYNQIVQADPDGYRSTLRALARYNILDRLEDIHNPTMVVTAENDFTVTPSNQHVLVEKIAGANQVTIGGAGHAVIAERPEIFNQALLQFLSSDSL